MMLCSTRRWWLLLLLRTSTVWSDTQTTTTTSTTATTAQKIVLTITVSGVDYGDLVSSPQIEDGFVRAVKTGIASQDPNFGPGNVETTLSAGSVVAENRITIPPTTTADAVLALAESSESSILAAVLAEVGNVPNINTVTTGTIGVCLSHCAGHGHPPPSTYTATPTTTTRAGDAACSSRHAEASGILALMLVLLPLLSV
mmetsp:Transcript_37981/g.88732  ORF Transcript_37981/g.88732 Transcript_37981/m.88732 type:complete len:200 (+) Transcript_37981:137-736(+)|eukprot:CAMPEP_0178386938 /NCGR_PEP_ID=MMETSP0689_2-20121128/8820_1 /TAXON_ID=160604 /ORGANISM="Amphidinium massartii, Strain CS-259" /LENGTH=199 /DNA_ID=CAMNT_0020007295 /DNA_START=54 /DNA_END=653 /DNA_ORIENTATION=+